MLSRKIIANFRFISHKNARIMGKSDCRFQFFAFIHTLNYKISQLNDKTLDNIANSY